MAQFGVLITPDAYIDISDFGDVGGIYLMHRKDNILLSIHFSYYQNMGGGLDILTLFGHAFLERGKDFDWMSGAMSPIYGELTFNTAFAYYLLPQMLSNYGPPSQVLLLPFPDDPERPNFTWQPFSLVLLYPEQGIIVEYVSQRETIGENFAGCPDKAHFSLGVWSPDSDLPLKTIVQKAGMEIHELNIDYFKPLEEATSLSLEEFYQIYKNPQNTQCIKTPISIWTE
ncbi:MAG: hypothetical protein PHS96_09785 [Anaerolineales bacterium]|nr:hypothetical protein [Anaerolineales bacterium]